MSTVASLEFDAAAHRYSIGTRELLSVTQVLTNAGLIDSQWFSEESRLRGTYVHQAILMHVEGDLAEDSLDPALQPYYQAFRAFIDESGFQIDACEERLFDEALGVAGTLDIRGRFPRPALRHPGVDIIDIKTGSLPSWVGYQTAGYARMLPRELGAVRWRWALHLQGDGTYRLIQLDKRTDEAVFLAAVTVAQAKRGWL
jgi:hypothetical protein